jgi:hypothetical protein
MVNSDKCSRCGGVESYRHLLWDWGRQEESGKRIMSKWSIIDNPIASWKWNKNKIIQRIIQIYCPVNWLMDNKLTIANELKNIELCNSTTVDKLPAPRLKWNIVMAH